MGRNYDKIQLPTNITDIAMLAVLLRVVKNNEPLTSKDSKELFQEAKRDGKRKKASKGDTHTEKTLFDYGLIKYIGKKEEAFVVTNLGEKLLSVYDDDGKVILSTSEKIQIFLEVFQAWYATNKGRDIHPGRIIVRLMCDAELEFYLTEQEIAHFLYNPGFKSDEDYEKIKEFVIRFRKTGGISQYTRISKSYIFMPSMVNNWGLMEKGTIETAKTDNDGNTILATDIDSALSFVEIDADDDTDDEDNEAVVDNSSDNYYKTVTQYKLSQDARNAIIRQYEVMLGVGNPFEVSTTTSDEITPDIIRAEAAKFSSIDSEADALYKEFQSHFAPSVLKLLSGKNMLDKLFYSDNRDEHNLCHTLEHDSRYQLFGGVKGGSSYKFGLFYSKEHSSWLTGSPKKPRKLTEVEAIQYGSEIRDELVAGAEIISNYGVPNTLNDYADLYAQVFKVMPNLINKMWVLKYLHMMFPELFPVFYNGEWQNSVLERLGIEPKEDTFIRMGQIALFVKKCGISNVAFSKVIYKLKADPESETSEEVESPAVPKFTFDTTKGGAQNRVVYGTPGCGKSFYVQNKYLEKCGVPTENRIRTTFYMDYTNTDFVGQILPKVKSNGEVTYEFNPGPFALALKMAVEKPNESVALIIEELNRGNAASIFGDIFQLLDRDGTGKSQYSITNVNLQNYLNQCFENVYIFNSISIPANLYIVATMNTSDQNVFTLDTAFKRRWQFEKIRNEFSDDHEYKDYFIPGMSGITWETLVTAINNYIVNRPDDLASEDKQLGVYFIDKATLCQTEDEITDEAKIDRFAFKLFEYLWDDVAKYARAEWFSANIKTLDALIDNYKKLGVKVFADGVLDL